MNGIAGMLLTLQIQAEQRRKNEEEAEDQLREQETKELVILRNGKEIPAHQVLDVDTVVITQDPQGNFVRSIKHE